MAARLTDDSAKIIVPTKEIRLTCCRKSGNNGGNGTEQKFTRSKEKKITLVFIQPGEPTQNAYIERFNGTFRRDVLNAFAFKSIKEVEQISFDWMVDYNYNRPHKALSNKTPMEYKVKI